jgi:hypothetical protein
MLLFGHSGLDPESSAVSRRYVSGSRIKSGMTIRKKAFFLNYGTVFNRAEGIYFYEYPY